MALSEVDINKVTPRFSPRRFSPFRFTGRNSFTFSSKGYDFRLLESECQVKTKVFIFFTKTAVLNNSDFFKVFGITCTTLYKKYIDIGVIIDYHKFKKNIRSNKLRSF